MHRDTKYCSSTCLITIPHNKAEFKNIEGLWHYTYRWYKHTHIHTYICTPTYIRTCIHTYIHTYVHTFIHTYIYTYHRHTHVHIHPFLQYGALLLHVSLQVLWSSTFRNHSRLKSFNCSCSSFKSSTSLVSLLTAPKVSKQWTHFYTVLVLLGSTMQVKATVYGKSRENYYCLMERYLMIPFSSACTEDIYIPCLTYIAAYRILLVWVVLNIDADVGTSINLYNEILQILQWHDTSKLPNAM